MRSRTISYGFLAAYLAIALVPADFWVTVNQERGTENMQAAFANVFGQGMWTIVGSIVAFLIGQLIDVTVFHRIRQLTGERWIWLRATGSTAISQLIDSFVVLYTAGEYERRLLNLPEDAPSPMLYRPNPRDTSGGFRGRTAINELVLVDEHMRTSSRLAY